VVGPRLKIMKLAVVESVHVEAGMVLALWIDSHFMTNKTKYFNTLL
jgi:hypothetical protein